MSTHAPSTETQHPQQKYMQPPFSGESTQESPGLEAAMKFKPDYGIDSYIGHDKLAGKTALITGGDSGIGRAVAVAFAKEGASSVVIQYLPEEQRDADETKAAIEKCSGGKCKCSLVPCALDSENACKSVAEQTLQAVGGQLHILVNNAAVQGKAVKSFTELTGDRIEKTFRVNIIAQFYLARELVPHMPPGGSIITTSSIQAYEPKHVILDYAATKGAIVAFTKGLARETVDNGVRVNSVAPGPVWTPLIVQSFPEDKVQEFGKASPMKRPAQPVEVAPCFVFLASDDARFVNGEILGCTGGLLLA